MNIHILVLSLSYLCCWCLWTQGIPRRSVLFLWIIIRQNILGRYIISLFDYHIPMWNQAFIAGKVFKFQYVRESIFVLLHKTFWHFCQSGTLHSNVNMQIYRNIYNWNTFRTTTLYRWGGLTGILKCEICTTGYVPQLNWN